MNNRVPVPGWREFINAHWPRIVQIVPELDGPFYMMAKSRVVAENIVYGDWGFDKRVLLHLLRYRQDVDGVHDKIIWLCYGHWDVHDAGVILHTAERTNKLLQATEFHPWLTKRMQDLAQVPANAGSLALEAWLRKSG